MEINNNVHSSIGSPLAVVCEVLQGVVTRIVFVIIDKVLVHPKPDRNLRFLLDNDTGDMI